MVMNEEIRRVRPHAENTAHEGQKTGDDGGRAPFVTGWQMAICLAALAAAYLIRLFGGGFYTTAQSYVRDALSRSITNAQVTEAFDALRSQLPDTSTLLGSSSQPESSSSSKPSSSPGAKNSSGSSSSKSSSAPGSSSGANDSKKTASGGSSSSAAQSPNGGSGLNA